MDQQVQISVMVVAMILAMVLARGLVMLVVSKEIVHTFVLEVAKVLVVVAVAVTIIKVINFNF